MSFDSKIVATVNPSKPIIDQHIFKHLKKIRPSDGDLKNRINKSIEIYSWIESSYKDILESGDGKYAMEYFEKQVENKNDYPITNTKKLDFILWQNRN